MKKYNAEPSLVPLLLTCSFIIPDEMTDVLHSLFQKRRLSRQIKANKHDKPRSMVEAGNTL